MSSDASSNDSVEVAVIGGGIGGLWTLNRLRAAGYNALLIERDALGSGQTIAAQGVLHGGIKYTLKGALNPTSETIAEMPGRWRDCLEGRGEIDLSPVRVLSEFQVLWSPATLGASLAGFFASKALRSRVEPLDPALSPEIFGHPAYRGSAWRIHEQVVDVPSLVEALAAPHREHIVQGHAALEGGTLRIGDRTLSARHVVLAAGAGNQTLCGDEPPMQCRPLHQVIVRGTLPPFYSVCLGGGARPRLVATTHPAGDGASAWYLGGDLAETGVERSESEQVAFARRELETLLPWIDLSQTDWSTLRIDRAEPAEAGGRLPSGVFCRAEGNRIVTWPTKLVLAPLLADAVLDTLPPPAGGDAVFRACELGLPSPPVATPAWL